MASVETMMRFARSTARLASLAALATAAAAAPTRGVPAAPSLQRIFARPVRRDQIARLRARLGATILIGHLQNNPQNGPTTESGTYNNQWSTVQRIAYLRYWSSQKAALGYRFMAPAFYALCPGARSFDASQARGPEGRTLLDAVGQLRDTPTGR